MTIDQDPYQQTLRRFREILHADPACIPAHYQLGLLFLKHQEWAAAQIQFKNVLTLDPNHLQARFYSGVLHLQADELEEAERAFQTVLAQDNEQIQALINLGVIALKRDHGQLAVDYFSKALALDNENEDARNNLAATFMHYDRFENALMHYDVLLTAAPDNIEYLYNSGVAQMALGHLNEAIAHFEKLLSLQPHHFAALNNLAAIYIRLEDKVQARTLLEQAIAVNPSDQSSQHMLKALQNQPENADTCPDYAENLFNNYALYYDAHLLQQLHYQLPQHIEALLETLPVASFAKALDLGCGTGLTGQIVRAKTATLIGVDLAKKMLDQAKTKNIYDALIESEIGQFLKQDQQLYNLILAADVLPYFGELQPLFQLIDTHLAAKGYFIFSTEISPNARWRLQESARFCHHPDYINERCQQRGWTIITQKQVIARQQNGKGMPVLLTVAGK